jgi:hypothetical protein
VGSGRVLAAGHRLDRCSDHDVGPLDEGYSMPTV